MVAWPPWAERRTWLAMRLWLWKISIVRCVSLIWTWRPIRPSQGHQAGDEVLKITGRILRESVRADDVAARYGGEEFIVLLPHTPKEGAHRFAEKFRKMMAEYEYPNRECQPLKCVSLSGGVATFPDDGRTGAELIVAADAALYKSKKAGRNRVACAKLNYFSEESDDASYGGASG